MTKVTAVLLLLVGIINFLPVIGVLSGARIAQAYSVDVAGSDLEILLRHRALLFGIIGGFVFYSLFVPAMQWPAMVMAGVSMLGFLVLTWQVGGYNASLTKVLWVDVVGIVLLFAAVLTKALAPGAN